jgi:hypothetical protein
MRILGATFFSLCLLVISDDVVSGSVMDVDFSGSYRLRYETLNNPIFPTTKAVRSQSNQRLSSRLFVKADATLNKHIGVTVELGDSRVFLDENDPTLSSNQVNTIEPLQFYLTYTASGDGALKSWRAGRQEVSYGSRRLLSNTVYRNANNMFDGVVIDWRVLDWNVHTLYLQPVSRLPTDSTSISNNESAFDKSYRERVFYGVYATSQDNALKVQSYWLKERDSNTLATKNRDLYTLSVDYTFAFLDHWKANVEVIGQTGTSHLTNKQEDTTPLDVRAYMVFGYVGKQLSSNTFLRAEIDYISGDNNSADGTISDFDTLYGVRRFDFGPTDVYQAMPRRNLATIGLRSISKPVKSHHVMAAYKAMWYKKTPVDAERFIGHQVEARWRWQVLPSLRLALGGAYLHKGEGLKRGDYTDNSMFAFTGALYTF